MRRRLVVLSLAALLLVVWGVQRLFFHGVVFRGVGTDPAADKYLAELLEDAPGAHPSLAVSADQRFMAFATDAAASYHTVHVLDQRLAQLVQVVTIEERDPGSGTSHGLSWSGDSQALLISGSGRLLLRDPGPLCLVYLPKTDSLSEVGPCR